MEFIEDIEFLKLEGKQMIIEIQKHFENMEMTKKNYKKIMENYRIEDIDRLYNVLDQIGDMLCGLKYSVDFKTLEKIYKLKIKKNKYVSNYEKVNFILLFNVEELFNTLKILDEPIKYWIQNNW